MDVTVVLDKNGHADLTPYAGQVIEKLTIDIRDYTNGLAVQAMDLIIKAARECDVPEEKIREILAWIVANPADRA